MIEGEDDTASPGRNTFLKRLNWIVQHLRIPQDLLQRGTAKAEDSGAVEMNVRKQYDRFGQLILLGTPVTYEPLEDFLLLRQAFAARPPLPQQGAVTSASLVLVNRMLSIHTNMRTVLLSLLPQPQFNPEDFLRHECQSDLVDRIGP